ncbi:DEAD/DEAH box helicase [Paraburkholderia hospita]|uniref:Non-specific serine/threonine protein kinase n=1 Tax=Paraburkholderia hospita TaxID=169430 RepID=A0ABP2PD71_9BURK|nr:DEAD/DEAH box helicase [Paraburkholderia hospita]EIM95284.1 non-specific serine/threonine protein kinase [Paraburkholderia hospita]OUL68103.1 ATP-dependent helicase [Paraburkholderia hospita]OUL84749.1 ATP-dependent helicase [Paraburkholderia hospita]SEI28188.1 Superfamily II DNA or RNA helicase, SNF2 family [Paraburkholderia hospita]
MFSTDSDRLAPKITPAGHLLAAPDVDAPALPDDVALGASFRRGTGHGLLYLGSATIGRALPPAWAWWRDFGARYVTSLCTTPEGEEVAVSQPDTGDFERLIEDAPPMTGAEYLTSDVLVALWGEIDIALRDELASTGESLQTYLKSRHPAWNLVGRVHFNLAENRKDPEAPFAFLATYAARISAHGKTQHQPLSRALEEFSGARNKAKLLSLLMPVRRAADRCDWLRAMLESREIYHPLRWMPADAYRLLCDLPTLESAGIMVRLPATWATGRPARPAVRASVGTQPPSLLGKDALLDFRMEVSLDGEPLTPAEIRRLLKGADGLQWIRGRWIEVDTKKLGHVLHRFESLEKAAQSGLPLNDALRLLAGVSGDEAEGSDERNWAQVVAGNWLAETLGHLRQPEGLAQVDPGPDLRAQLRPYQRAGVRWLYLLSQLGLGACLADDMGLGKTMQVLSLLLVLKRDQADSRPSLLIAPASLLANWVAEAERFAPGLRVLVAHPSVTPAEELRALNDAQLTQTDLVITSFGSLLRQPALETIQWRIAIVDEAQAIKNPGARQTKQVKKLQAQSRIALTGTPVENRSSDLWSIFDFTHPGLLGSAKEFAGLTRRLAKIEHFGPLRTLVRPYILRRLKTDRRVIADLPEKTELKAWCHLSPVQAALYERAVKDLAAALDGADGIERKGIVLSYLMRFKQICNHPSQWLGDAAWSPEASGKFARLRELVDVIAAKQEKVLVFTQFRETTEPLAAFLGSLFGREGLVLHGGTPVGKRRELVRQFQEDESTPFFVLSLKAGGSGLNLTSASHVIHFDRWWNPAVENQATDRAFRIGQRKNVLVHKFVCQGTVEDRIDQLIESKQQLVNDMLEGGAELQLTEMSDQELLALVKLDIHSAQEN